ncbi:glycosyltransferase involved in cell wall biosynthesis [Anaeroplasma bactoclasticum]|jgi:glycosyltransferase involved in cell wall biosynthesis|uniref:Glycosyltransferase involved in cell wall biosynthesis n=1 Tax=Anaeroplasma bactoclasticum TaxID=2088 RepID=A0A397QUI5_9MOLU|nr:glycosyltransferase family 2 protein [Anaeroplasma bactoclasticum]RIA64728.1 glycosyltransferase involved in cell wall biosynthesis [Anaeroplasma bactoclasticum]
MKKVFIVVPCYNEEETIEIYYNEVIKYLTGDYDYNVCFVNDGSKDRSLEIMMSLAEKDKRIKYLSFSRNFGKEAAMYAGLEAAKKAKADCAIIMDVDLQDPPHLIPELLKSHEEGYNLVFTRQKNRHGGSKLSAFFSLSFYKVYAFVTKDKGMAQGARDYCLLDKKAVNAFLSIKDHERFTKGIYHFVGFRQKVIEFDYAKRSAGTTKWNFKKLFHYAILGMREFSRFYEYIPKVAAWVVFFLLCFDTGKGIYNAVQANSYYAFDWNPIRIDGLFLILFIVLFYLFRLLYDVRKQTQRRPIYIEEDSNLEEVEENEAE